MSKRNTEDIMSSDEADLGAKKLKVNADEAEGGKSTKTKSESSDGTCESERPEPLPDRCNFYLERKKRYCKAPQPKGRIYCIEHSHMLGDATVRKRIACPLDPKHTCYEDQLQKHLKKCNASKRTTEPYYVENINSGSDEGEDASMYKVGVRAVDEATVLQLADRVQQLHKEHVPEIATEVLDHPVLQEMADKPENGPAAQKHIKQQASLVGHMEKLGLLENETSYIEFGAGKGGLSHWVQLSVKDFKNTQFLLIDRGSVRYKMDSYHKGADQGPSFERLKIDIQHLDLGKVTSLQSCTQSAVAFGKHLCGAATDLMIRCLMETLGAGKDEAKHRYGEEAEKEGEKESDGAEGEYNHPRYGNLRPQERERIGNQCKQLIDHGRIRYLQEHSLDARMAFYVDKSLSLENVVLLARSTGSSNS